MATNNAALVNRYIAYMKDPLRRRPQTIYTYHGRYRALLAHLGSTPFAQVTTTQLNDFVTRQRLDTRIRGPVAADATIAGDVAALRSLFAWLHEIEEVIARNPAKKLVAPKVDNENPKPCPPHIWKTIWFSSLEDDERVALGLAYFCGFRRFEVTGLAPRQVDGDLITSVVRKGGKKDGGFRWRSCVDLYASRLHDLIGPPDLFIGALHRLRSARDGYGALLPWATNGHVHTTPTSDFVDPTRFNKRLNDITRRLGVPPIHPHALRHSFGTNLCSKAAGVPIHIVSRLMGHSDIRITMRYVDIGSDPLAELLAEDTHYEELAQVNAWG